MYHQLNKITRFKVSSIEWNVQKLVKSATIAMKTCKYSAHVFLCHRVENDLSLKPWRGKRLPNVYFMVFDCWSISRTLKTPLKPAAVGLKLTSDLMGLQFHCRCYDFEHVLCKSSLLCEISEFFQLRDSELLFRFRYFICLP